MRSKIARAIREEVIGLLVYDDHIRRLIQTQARRMCKDFIQQETEYRAIQGKLDNDEPVTDGEMNFYNLLKSGRADV